MSQLLPQSTDKLNSPSHSLIHRIISVDSTSPQSSIDVKASGAVAIPVGIISPKIYPSADSTTALQILKADGATALTTWDSTNNKVKYLTGQGWYPSANDTAAFQFTQADGTTNIATIDTTNKRIGIGTISPNSTTHINGSFAGAYRAITANRTLDGTDYFIDCTANTFTVTLPTAVGIQGRMYVIKNTGTGVITVNTTSSQTIDGTLTEVISVQYGVLKIISNDANWLIVNS